MATTNSNQSQQGAVGERARTAVQSVYDRLVRPMLPRRLGVFNGVVARGDRLLDSVDTHPEYEAAIIRSLRDFVTPGADVVVVGGGIGVSTVVAANAAGEDGSVTTFEASNTHANEVIPETLQNNDTQADVDVRHAVVGESISTRGALAGAKQIPATELPRCRVLELDCEGAERRILREMNIRPSVLIVESHGCYGSPTHAVREDLVELGYRVLRTEPEVPQKDVMVLTAVRVSSNTSPDLGPCSESFSTTSNHGDNKQ